MALEQITDHADRAVLRLPMQNRTTKMELLVRVIAGRLQLVEDALWALFVGRALDTAVGAHLTNLARIVGVARAGRTDTALRLIVRVRIRLNRGGGTADDVLEVFRLLVGATNTLAFKEFPPASFELHVGEALPIDADEAAEILRASRAGGVGAQLVFTETTDALTFTLDGTPAQSLDAGLLAGVVDAG